MADSGLVLEHVQTSQSALDRGSKHYTDQLNAEVFRLRVRKDAQKRFIEEEAGTIEIPVGVSIDDPLPPEPPELIPGVLLAHGSSGVIGMKETGKSALALEIQFSLLTGEPLWGAIAPNKVIDKSVHFLAEHTAYNLMGLYKRMQFPSLGGRLKVFGPEHLGGHKLLVSAGIRREESLSLYKKLAEGAGLIVFDPLASYIQGEGAENDNAMVRHVIDSMIEIAQSTNAACLILGHQGKPQFFQGKQLKKTVYATRGASAAEDAMTAVHYLDREAGVTIDHKEVFVLRPIHYKGEKAGSFKLLRDKKTVRNTLYQGG